MIRLRLGHPAYDGAGNELVSGKVYPLSSNMVFTAPSAESPLAEDGVTLQATVKPDTADNKAVDWAVAFVNPTSTWETGKSAADYVSVTPTSDGATTATVACAEAFGEQIKITVTSRSNPNAKAECVVDFMKRIDSVAANIAGTSVAANGWFTAAFDLNSQLGTPYSLEFIPHYSDYTVDVTYNEEITLSLTPTFVLRAEALGLTIANKSIKEFGYMNFGAELFEYFFTSATLTNAVDRNKLVGEFAACAASNISVFSLSAAFKAENLSFTYLCNVTVDASSIPILVESIDLNNDSLVF